MKIAEANMLENRKLAFEIIAEVLLREPIYLDFICADNKIIYRVCETLEMCFREAALRETVVQATYTLCQPVVAFGIQTNAASNFVGPRHLNVVQCMRIVIEIQDHSCETSRLTFAMICCSTQHTLFLLLNL